MPYTQSLEFFTALQRQGVPSKLVVFPDEGHWICKPQNSVVWYREFLGWLDRYLAPRQRLRSEPAMSHAVSQALRSPALPVDVSPWYREVNRTQWKAFLASYLGWMLDGFDFTILTFLLVDIQRSFTVRQGAGGRARHGHADLPRRSAASAPAPRPIAGAARAR